jgi:O-antigen/teichoic acid export membrane protein
MNDIKTQTSLKKNYIYNILSIISNILIPLITFPYIARILGPDVMGKISIANNLGLYFISIASVGIPVYGLKEISKNRDSFYKISKTFSELLIINLSSVIFSLIIYFFIFLNNPSMQSDQTLYLITGFTIFFSFFSIDWLFSGLEDYKYITVRSLFVKIVSLVLIFILVKDKNHYLLYSLIVFFSFLLNNILNFIFTRGKVGFTFRNLEFLKHKKALFALTLASIIGSIYAYMDVLLLGSLASDTSVGFYTTTKKIIGLVIGMIGSLGTVLVPRLSYFLANRMHKEYKDLIQTSLNFVYFLALPAIIFILIMSEEILLLFGGVNFLPANLSLRLISFQLLFTSIATLFGFQIILLYNDERALLKANLLGAVVNLLFNLFFINLLLHDATSIAITLSEMVVAVTLIIFSKKYVTLKLFSKTSLIYLEGSILVGFFLIISKTFLNFNYFIMLLITFCLSILLYCIFLIYKKDYFIISFKSFIKNLIK